MAGFAVETKLLKPDEHARAAGGAGRRAPMRPGDVLVVTLAALLIWAVLAGLIYLWGL